MFEDVQISEVTNYLFGNGKNAYAVSVNNKIKKLEKQLAELIEHREKWTPLNDKQAEKIGHLNEKLKISVELIREAYEDTDLYTYYEMMPRFKEVLEKIK
jgi:ribosome-interacting GTPase 1